MLNSVGVEEARARPTSFCCRRRDINDILEQREIPVRKGKWDGGKRVEFERKRK